VRRAVALAALLAAAACSSGQDPGLVQTTVPGTVTTSRLLAPCPAGGPDATTPPAGCLDPDGNVVQP